ncbi:MAG: hypothetical protein JST93_14500, partial [Acidobacteria bacterium]|nr:hypothetical protein [Acidobacteriota bacterium]
MEHQVVLQPFLGIVTSVDKSLIPPTAASDMLNVRCENGKPLPRYGWNQLQSGSGSGFTSSSGLVPVRGFDSTSGDEAFEFLSFETRSGNLRPYSVNKSTGVRSAITDGGVTVNLSVGEWNATGYGNYAYAHQVGGSVYRHIIGTNTSWKAVDVSAPPVPTHAPTVQFRTTETTDTAGAEFSWAGGGAGTITNTGGGSQNVAFVSITSGKLNLNWPTVAAAPATSYEFNLDMSTTTAGNQDWSTIKWIEFDLTQSVTSPNNKWLVNYPFGENVLVTLTNAAGTKTIVMEMAVTRVANSQNVIYTVRGTFPSSKVAADWTATKTIKVYVNEYYISHDTQNVSISLSKVRTNVSV